MKNILPANIQIILVPLGMLFAMAILIIISVNFGFSKIASQRDEIAKANRDENVLRSKEALLRAVGNTVLSQADSSSIAVPPSNPALVVLAQLKNAAVSKGITLENLKVSNPGKYSGSVSKITINFDESGNMNSLLDFIGTIANLSPIMTLQEVKISQSQGATRVSATLESYWAPFPKSLPQFTEPIEQLSNDENQVVSKLSALAPPPFSEVAPSAPGARSDPFNF